MTTRSWHQAMTLAERARRFRDAASVSPATEQDSARGRRRLEKWKAQPPFDSTVLFQQRLKQDGLSESELRGLLSGGNIDWGSGPGGEPHWVREWRQALSSACETDSVIYSENPDEHPEILLLELVRPWVLQALSRLREEVRRVAVALPAGGGALAGVDQLFLNLLPGRLLAVLARTMVLELNVARVEGRLSGETRQQRFLSFIELLRQPTVRLEFFREYPVLARLVATVLDQWVNTSGEFLQRWCADAPLIRDEFHLGEDPGPLVGITADAGDSHRGGRTVWILECRSGFRIVYKPKCLSVDRHFQELLEWLNQQGLAAPFRPLRIVDRGDYGWEEFVCPGPCSSREEIVRFYQRTGGYLALLYALAATDFHHGNVLAVGEHPVLVDLEALFHPTGLEPVGLEASEIAEHSFGESVLGSGLLPVPVCGGGDAGTFDLSGLGAEAGQKIPMYRSGWRDRGTDEMQYTREALAINSSDHRPSLQGIPANPLDYLDEIDAGFRQVYRLLEEHHGELLAADGPIHAFARDEVRVVLRNSSRYSELLQEGSHPDVLRDALDRDRLFDRLWEEVPDQPRLAQLIPAEVEDLWRGDLPLFTTRPDSRDLWAGDDRHFPDMLKESGLERTRQRLSRMGDDDLRHQLWFLRGSLTTLASAKRPAARRQRPGTSDFEVAVDRAQLLAACNAIGDRLAATALHGAEDLTWIGLNFVRHKQWILSPLGLDLYDGLPGIVLFLAHLGQVSGEERYSTLARRGLATVRRRIDPGGRGKGFKQIGGYFGWGGVLYALAHLGVLWDDPSILTDAHDLVEGLPGRIERDQELDIIGGAAGCIAGLLCLQSCHPSARVLETARLCGEQLIRHARPMEHGLGWASSFANRGPLTGFSHGAAGISWALLELAAQTGEHRFQTAALGGMAYERGLFSAQVGNWPDLRMPDAGTNQGSTTSPLFSIAWCHGAPGIGLARLLCRRLVDDPLLDAEIEAALRTTASGGFGSSHCLCHGDLGNLELIVEAGRRSPTSSQNAKAGRLLAGVVDSIGRDGWLCGNPLAVESPGLMTGLAGIGYGLLRCAEPEKVPSVLSLAPPIPTRVGARRIAGNEHASLER